MTGNLLTRARATRPVEFARRSSDLVAAGTGLFTLVLSGLVARTGRVGSAERAVFRVINSLPDFLYPLFWPFMQLGNLVLGPLVALVALVLARYRLAAAAIAVTIAKLGTERVVKQIVERSRPSAVIDDVTRRGDAPVHGLSFVSGHLVLVVGLAMVVTPYLRGRWRLVPPILAALVGVGRIYVGAHNPLDVVGGAGLGLAIGGIVNYAVGVPSPETRPQSSVHA